jgi:hypothetical protein
MFLAALARDVPVELIGEAGPDYVRRLWYQTRTALRILGITSAASLHIWLQGHRGELRTWMQADSRYGSRLPGPAPSQVGGYMQDYEQEFLISRLMAMGSDTFHVLGAVLLAVVQAASLRVPQEVGRQGLANLRNAPQPDPAVAEESDEEMAELPASALREPRGPTRAAWASLDDIHLAQEMRFRVPCLKAVPKFLRPGLK